MTSEELLKEAILNQYGSVNRFAEKLGIAESSVRNIFKRGIGSVNAGTLVMICKKLNVDVEALVDGTFSPRPNDLKESLCNEYGEQLNNEPIYSNTPAVSDEGEREILSIYRGLTVQGRDMLIAYGQLLHNQGFGEKDNQVKVG